ncbi:MAG: hypothetical protein Kow0010_16090 [Dehalococcoidia bacterium]
MERREVHVVASDPLLRRALIAKLRSAQLEGVVMPEHDGRDRAPRPGDVVITPAADCDLQRCADLTGAGVRVIILAPIPRESERQHYLGVGASGYVLMTIDSNDLIEAIRTTIAN